MQTQSQTPVDLVSRPDKSSLQACFQRKPLDVVRTPALVIDRKVFAQNCARMHEKAKQWGAKFRAHLKTHKTVEGTRLQLVSEADKTNAVVVSTLMEAWEVWRGGLVADGTVSDILYGLPIGANKIGDAFALQTQLRTCGAELRLLLDHPDQVKLLEDFTKEKIEAQGLRWSVFVKIDGGQHRAGVSPLSPAFVHLVQRLLDSPVISLYGFYGHAGDSYGSKSLSDAVLHLSGEVTAVNTAAETALGLLAKCANSEVHTQPFVLSVGSTPTAHAAGPDARAMLASTLHGVLELHAGNYPMLDLQQQHTTLIDRPQIAHRVRAMIVSYYPGRGTDGTDEALIDAGAIALSKDTGPLPGFGDVIAPVRGWRLGRISQEHGILVQTETANQEGASKLSVGTVVDIIGQHACLVAAAHPWYYIVDSDVGGGEEIVDVWVPWKGW